MLKISNVPRVASSSRLLKASSRPGAFLLRMRLEAGTNLPIAGESLRYYVHDYLIEFRGHLDCVSYDSPDSNLTTALLSSGWKHRLMVTPPTETLAKTRWSSDFAHRPAHKLPS